MIQGRDYGGLTGIEYIKVVRFKRKIEEGKGDDRVNDETQMSGLNNGTNRGIIYRNGIRAEPDWGR